MLATTVTLIRHGYSRRPVAGLVPERRGLSVDPVVAHPAALVVPPVATVGRR
jgi:hypothetical protein